MDLWWIGLAAFFAAGLTLFSGFGLGTLLTPVFALFFPLPLAIAGTAVVHLANNVFKLGLLVKHANWRVVWRFGLPAMAAAVLGALLLAWIGEMPTWLTWSLGERRFEITPLKALIGLLICSFAALEMSSRFARVALPPRWLPVGGVLSGFFGGLSGNQGALRSAFLIKLGLPKRAFVATGGVIAVIIDASRIGVYGLGDLRTALQPDSTLLLPILIGTLCAFPRHLAGLSPAGQGDLAQRAGGGCHRLVGHWFGFDVGRAVTRTRSSRRSWIPDQVRNDEQKRASPVWEPRLACGRATAAPAHYPALPPISRKERRVHIERLCGPQETRKSFLADHATRRRAPTDARYHPSGMRLFTHPGQFDH
jgi:uncharacterized membrane protein YfcA